MSSLEKNSAQLLPEHRNLDGLTLLNPFAVAISGRSKEERKKVKNVIFHCIFRCESKIKKPKVIY